MVSKSRSITGSILLGSIFLFAVVLGRDWLLAMRGRDRTTDLPKPANPFLNSAADVGYVGDEVCARCHADVADSYAKHPMGKSSTPIGKILPLEKLGKKNQNPFQASGLVFSVEAKIDSEVHRIVKEDAEGKAICGSEAAVQFAIGANVRGRSYLINREGYVYQSPISWYTDRQAWDLSPHLGGTVQQLYRPVTVQCLFCHCNSVDPVEDAGNKYRIPIIRGYAIGCERCHGPGELHAQARGSAEQPTSPDYTIVNPRHLSPAERESVCQQCHLQGLRVRRRGHQVFDYRPGLPLKNFLSVFVSTGVKRGLQFAGQVEQMYASQCFQASNGRLGCISCHDPHRKPDPDQRVAYYRSRCLTCHAESDCRISLPDRSKEADSCIACHMKRLPNTNIAHMASTDHRILRWPDPEPVQPSSESGPFEYFFDDNANQDDPEIARDLGVGLMDLAALKQAERNRRWLAQTAEPALGKAVHLWPDDVAAWQAYGYSLWLLERRPEAMSVFEQVLELAPRREETLVYAAGLSTQLSRLNDAANYWQRSLSVNPFSVRSHLEYAQLLGRQGNWQGCTEECQAALKFDPFSASVRKQLIVGLIRLGSKDKAALELDKLLRMNPSEGAAIRAWYDRQPAP
jgi:hypothetical protein